MKSALAAPGPARHRLLIALVTLAVNAVFLVALPARWRQNINPDYINYYEPVARNFLAGNGFRPAADAPLSIRYPPGFALALAPVFTAVSLLRLPETLAINLFIAMMGVATALLLYEIVRRVFNARIGLLAALLWTTYPFYLWLTKQPNPESPFMAFLYLAVYCLLRGLESSRPHAGWALAAGAATGAAGLVRPISIVYAAVLVAAVLIWKNSWSAAARLRWSALLVAANILTVLPWEVLVWRETGKWIPLCDNGGHSIYEGFTFAVTVHGSGKLLEVDPDVLVLMTEIDRRAHAREFDGASGYFTFLARQLGPEPVPVIKLMLLKLGRAWYGTSAQWFEDWILMLQMPYLAAMLAGAWLAFRRHPASRPFLFLVLLTVLYFWGMAILVVPLLRYMVPAIGLLMALAAITVDTGLEKMLGERYRNLPV